MKYNLSDEQLAVLQQHRLITPEEVAAFHEVSQWAQQHGLSFDDYLDKVVDVQLDKFDRSRFDKLKDKLDTMIGKDNPFHLSSDQMKQINLATSLDNKLYDLNAAGQLPAPEAHRSHQPAADFYDKLEKFLADNHISGAAAQKVKAGIMQGMQDERTPVKDNRHPQENPDRGSR